MTIDKLVLALINGAGCTDAKTLLNKAEVSMETSALLSSVFASVHPAPLINASTNLSIVTVVPPPDTQYARPVSSAGGVLLNKFW